MSKRSDFPRSTNDLYNTPLLAALPLFAHLHGVKTYAEPCFGDGYLHEWLTSFGLECVYQGDISTGQDALTNEELGAAQVDAIITNPPYLWAILEPMLVRFLALKPTWLLLEMDFASNHQASRYMNHCTDVVPIGRVKWFEDSKHASYENYAWFRFSAQHVRGPHLHSIVKLDKRKLNKLSAADAFRHVYGQ